MGKRKMIVGYASIRWMKNCWKENDLSGIVIAKASIYEDGIQVAILPLDDLEAMEADHEAQLEYAAMELAGSVGNKKHQLPYKEWLKRLHSIRAKEVTKK